RSDIYVVPPNRYSVADRTQRHAQLFSLQPFSTCIYESGFANFHQGLSPEQKLQSPNEAGSVCMSRQFWVRMEWRTVAEVRRSSFPDIGLLGLQGFAPNEGDGW